MMKRLQYGDCGLAHERKSENSETKGGKHTYVEGLCRSILRLEKHRAN